MYLGDLKVGLDNFKLASSFELTDVEGMLETLLSELNKNRIIRVIGIKNNKVVVEAEVTKVKDIIKILEVKDVERWFIEVWERKKNAITFDDLVNVLGGWVTKDHTGRRWLFTVLNNKVIGIPEGIEAIFDLDDEIEDIINELAETRVLPTYLDVLRVGVTDGQGNYSETIVVVPKHEGLISTTPSDENKPWLTLKDLLYLIKDSNPKFVKVESLRKTRLPRLLLSINKFNF